MLPGGIHVVLVAGYAGSGKTEFSKRVAEGLSWPIIDKDVTTRPLVEALISRLSGDKDDRQSPVYLNLVRPLEYQTLVDTVLDNVKSRLSVVVTAPFLQELTNPHWVNGFRNALKTQGANLRIVWVDCDADVMGARIRQRGATRDKWKLDHWDDYLNSIDPSHYIEVADDIVENNLESFRSLDESASHFIATVAAPASVVKALHW